MIPSDPMPTKLLEERPEVLEEPTEVDTKPLEEKPTVLAKDNSSDIVPIPSDVSSDVPSEALCAKCKKSLKPKRVRKARTKAQLEASKRNLSKRWKTARKKLEAIPEEKAVAVVEEDWQPPPPPRQMVGKRQEPVRANPFDAAF